MSEEKGWYKNVAHNRQSAHWGLRGHPSACGVRIYDAATLWDEWDEGIEKCKGCERAIVAGKRGKRVQKSRSKRVLP